MLQNTEQEDQEDWLRIAELKPDLRSINVRFLVIEKASVRQVRSKTTGCLHEVCEYTVSDDTGSIKLTLWNDEVDEVSLNETYNLVKGYIRVYDECMFLSLGRLGTITISEEKICRVEAAPDMSKPFAWKPFRKKKRSANGRSFQGKSGREAKGYCSRKSF